MKARFPVRLVTPSFDVTQFVGFSLVAGLGLGLAACSSDSRDEPSPRQTCRELAQECAGLGFEISSECAEIGERGLADPSYEDQCFVYYDGCIDECRWFTLWGQTQGSDDTSGEAGTDEATSDASTPVPDASAPTDAGTAS